jgi:hypothetical protein
MIWRFRKPVSTLSKLQWSFRTRDLKYSSFQILSIDSSSSTTRRVRFEYRVVCLYRLYENQGTEKSSFETFCLDFHMLFFSNFWISWEFSKIFWLKNFSLICTLYLLMVFFWKILLQILTLLRVNSKKSLLIGQLLDRYSIQNFEYSSTRKTAKSDYSITRWDSYLKRRNNGFNWISVLFMFNLLVHQNKIKKLYWDKLCFQSTLRHKSISDVLCKRSHGEVWVDFRLSSELHSIPFCYCHLVDQEPILGGM